MSTMTYQVTMRGLPLSITRFRNGFTHIARSEPPSPNDPRFLGCGGAEVTQYFPHAVVYVDGVLTEADVQAQSDALADLSPAEEWAMHLR